MHPFTITIEGPGWTELDEVELPRPPAVGDPIETKVGTCVVTAADLPPNAERGTIVCRLP